MSQINLQEQPKMKKLWRIRKFKNCASCGEFGTCKHNLPYKVSEFEQNVLLNEGINELWTIVASASSGTKFDNSNAYLGVGDDDTAAAASQTGLQAATNKLYKAMDGGFPTFGTSQKATWRATFGGSDANFAWKEFTVANGNSDSAKNLNRKVEDEGTKTSGQTWELTLEITLS